MGGFKAPVFFGMPCNMAAKSLELAWLMAANGAKRIRDAPLCFLAYRQRRQGPELESVLVDTTDWTVVQFIAKK
ncbi:unnamed protein product [Gongylonema pulchrum]|uniref:Molybdopterin molybdotransferase n=1 Tax=Gongylonema pulchrum TaxID=637853 RepID=A0A183EE34_9BILA|nr:unnamed protein product [Gongylonema pulchrum]